MSLNAYSLGMKFIGFLIIGALFLSAPDAHAGKSTALSFNELIKFHKKDRQRYLKFLAKNLVKMDSKSRKISWLESLGLYSFYTRKPATEKEYRGICGGILVEGTESTSCGINSYAGFSCPAGKEICNPFVFGVKNETTPLCFDNATTERCDENSELGVTTFSDPVFNKPGIREDYEAFRRDLERACSGSVKIHETSQAVEAACDTISKRTGRIRRTRPAGDEPPISLYPPVPIQKLAYSPSLFENEEEDELGGGESTSVNPFLGMTGRPEDYPLGSVEGVGVSASYFKQGKQYADFVAKLKEILEKNSELKKSQRALEHALAFFYKYKDGGAQVCGGDEEASSSLKNQEWMVVTDYTIPKSEERLFYINIRTGEIKSDFAAHGFGSGRGDMPQDIGDANRSNKTSGGFFETGEIYTSKKCTRWNGGKTRCRGKMIIRPTFGGQPDNAIKLRGLMDYNRNAFIRGIVHHGATYVKSDGAKSESAGCPAPQVETFYEMKDRIAEGALLYLHTHREDGFEQPSC